ncbi:glycosyltransferase family 2 protein [Clostridium butyricum]|uniref:glycosyltransferase family 2 protein n=1 Tax=Clostridium butyricum TaxID=1492 RepID=UPI0006A7B4CD|nr:glycosyltransferase family 2 protein [Clostridium butyricum]
MREYILPKYEIYKIDKKKNKYAICIPVINEGDKFINQLKNMKKLNIQDVVDIIICDGGSTDGSVDLKVLKEYNVNTLIIRKSPGHLSDQLMLGYYYAMEQGYEGTVTIDGNGKDGLEGIFEFVKALDEGYDLIQGSRYIKGGQAINTPKSREIAIKLIHVPIINFLSKFKYTDTTNGFRAHSIQIFKDDRINPFRYGDFPTYSLIHYLTVIVPRLGYKVKEVPVLRQYPSKGKVPTKISFFKGNFDLLRILFNLSINKYNPKN